MATLDQLPPDRRAILELVLQRGQSYEDLSSTLGMAESRVRDHAREALASLAPRTAERVDPQWRGQVADYVLGQQSGPQAKATRSHLKGSEPARTWALSVLDSVGHLYPNGAEPAIPAAGGRAAGDGDRRGVPAAAGVGAVAGAAAQEEGARDGPAAGGGEAPAESAAPAAAGAATAEDEPARSKRTGPMSPEARRVVRRRRIAGGAAGLLVLAAVVLLVLGVFGGDEPAEEGADTAQTEPEVTSQIILEPVDGDRGAGAAIIARREDQTVLVMQGRLPPLDKGEAYVVWLYNGTDDAVPVAVPQSDRRGNIQAVAPLPADYEQYEFIDVSLQERSDRTDHSGNSILRGPVAGSADAGAPAPEGGLSPEGGLAPEGGVPPGGTELPDPGSLPTAPEGG